MNSLLLVSLLVAAVSAGTNVLYTPHFYGHGYGFPYGHPFGYAGVGHPFAYSAFPGYAYHPYGYPALVSAEKAEDEPAAEEGDRKKRDTTVVAAHHVPGFYSHAYPYAFPYAHHPYPAVKYVEPKVEVVKYEAPKVEVKKFVHPAPFPYAAYPFGYGFYHGAPYVKLVKKEEEAAAEEPAAEESSRKKRQVLLATPYAAHPVVYSAPVVKPVEVEHKYKSVHLAADPEADTPADTTLVGLEEKEHTFKTKHYPTVYSLPVAHHYPYAHPFAPHFVVKKVKSD